MRANTCCTVSPKGATISFFSWNKSMRCSTCQTLVQNIIMQSARCSTSQDMQQASKGWPNKCTARHEDIAAGEIMGGLHAQLQPSSHTQQQ